MADILLSNQSSDERVATLLDESGAPVATGSLPISAEAAALEADIVAAADEVERSGIELLAAIDDIERSETV